MTENNKKSTLEKTVDAALTKEGASTIGGYLGSSIGIAALGTAVAGTLPVAIVGGIVGYLAVKAFSKKKKK